MFLCFRMCVTVAFNVDHTRYDLGGVDLDALTGEALITALKQQEEGRTIARGAQGVLDTNAGPAGPAGVAPCAAEVTGKALRAQLTFPEGWGPSEWGPIPFLPNADILVRDETTLWVVGDGLDYTPAMICIPPPNRQRAWSGNGAISHPTEALPPRALEQASLPVCNWAMCGLACSLLWVSRVIP